MIKKWIKKTCIWLLNKVNDGNNKKIDLSYKYNKVSKQKLVIRNNSIKSLISKDIFLFNIDNNKEIKPYMNTCIKSYKDHNPDFNIHFININKKEFYNNEIVKSIIENYKIKLEDIDENFSKIYNDFKYKWIYTTGGIWCDLTTYCCRNFNDLVLNSNFMMCGINKTQCFKNDCCFGIQKGYIKEIDNMVYPPINYIDEKYETMKISFYNGILNSNMFNNIVNIRLHNYIYDFK